MVSSLNFLGSYSGIDSAAVDAMIEAESGKLVQYSNKQANLTNQNNAWKDINTRLNSLYEKVGSFSDVSTFHSKTISNSDESKISIISKTGAQPSNYSISIQQLATSSQLTSGRIETASITEKLALSGTFSIFNHEEKETKITIGNNDSLKDIVGKINDTSKDSGIQAKIIDNRIVLTDSKMGDRNIKVDGPLSESLGFSLELSSRTEGKSAMLKVDGIDIVKDTNEIDDAIDGITIRLKGITEESKPVTIGVVEDTEKTIKAFQDFVDQYNSTFEFIGTQLSVGDPTAAGNKTGALVGDSSVMRLESSLRSLMTTNSSNDPDVKNLEDLGITLDRYGKATLNSTKLKTTLAENPKAAQNFFSHVTTTETGEVDENSKPITIEKKDGLAEKIQSLINGYISEKTGIIATKATTFDNAIKDISKSITKFNERLEKKRANYIAMFTRLDTAMMQAESQMSFLAAQFNPPSTK